MPNSCDLRLPSPWGTRGEGRAGSGHLPAHTALSLKLFLECLIRGAKGAPDFDRVNISQRASHLDSDFCRRSGVEFLDVPEPSSQTFVRFGFITHRVR